MNHALLYGSTRTRRHSATAEPAGSTPGSRAQRSDEDSDKRPRLLSPGPVLRREQDKQEPGQATPPRSRAGAVTRTATSRPRLLSPGQALYGHDRAREPGRELTRRARRSPSSRDSSTWVATAETSIRLGRNRRRLHKRGARIEAAVARGDEQTTPRVTRAGATTIMIRMGNND